MRQIQHIVLTDKRQTLQRQQCHLAGLCAADISHAFQTGLHDLLIGVGSLRDPVDIFVVVQTLDAALFLFEILEDREGDVRLERQQSAVGVRKGDDTLRRQEILVLRVKIVLLELSHLILFISMRAVQLTQCENRQLVLF